MNKLLENYKEGKLSVGCLLWDRWPLAMQALSSAGFSYVIIDMMFGLMNWDDVHHMILAAKDAGLMAMVRLQAYPWTGRGDEPDRRLVSHAARAASLGAEGITMSVANVEEVRLVAMILKDWHRPGVPITTAAELKELEDKIKNDVVIQPFIEDVHALEQLEEIINVEGVNSVRLSTTDLPRQMGYPYQYEHPEVWRYVDRAVELAHKKGLAIGANTGYFVTGVEDTARRIERLRDHGLDFVLVQTGDHMLYSFAKSVLDSVGNFKK